MEEDTLVEALELKFLHFKCSYSIEIKEIAHSTSPSLSSDSAFQSQLSCHANDMRAGERGGGGDREQDHHLSHSNSYC